MAGPLIDGISMDVDGKSKRRRHNWRKIRLEYIHGIQGDKGLEFPTLNELAARHNIYKSLVDKHSMSEKWADDKAKFKADVETESRRKRIDQLSQESITLDTQFLQAVRIGQASLTNLLGKHAAALRILNDKLSSDADKDRAKQDLLDTRELSNVAGALVNYQRVSKVALGEPENKRIQIEGELKGTGVGPTIIIETFMPESEKARQLGNKPT